MAKKDKVEVVEQTPVDAYGEFEMMNPGKYERAVSMVGNTDDKRAILAAYDSLGGFIRYQNNKVLTGGFWNFKTKQPHVEPQPKILRRQAAVVEETVEVVDVVDVETEAPKRGRGKKTKEAETE